MTKLLYNAFEKMKPIPIGARIVCPSCKSIMEIDDETIKDLKWFDYRPNGGFGWLMKCLVCDIPIFNFGEA